MSRQKLNQLFRTAQPDAPPAPPAGFENRVLAAIRRETGQHNPEASTWLEPLTPWFPRLGFAAAAVITLSIAVDFGLGIRAQADLGDSLVELSEQWLFAAN